MDVKCTKCKVIKDGACFYKRGNGRLREQCSECEKKYATKYRNNPKNHNKIKEHRRDYYKKYGTAPAKKWRTENPEKYLDSKKRSDKKYYEKNKNGLIKEYKLRTINEFRIRDNIYRSNRKKIDIRFKIKVGFRSHISNSLRRKSIKPRGKLFSGLSYTVEDLKKHLEKQFEPWMSWNNYGRGVGKWSIDHIRPESSFNYKSIDDIEFKECWSLKNLRPMEYISNIRKGNKII